MASSSSSSPSRWSHSQISVFDSSLTVVDFGERLLIGAQVATLLKRETFNMYRSMKIKRINIRRASPGEVAFLVKAEAVRVGTHSVTLIPLEKGLYFIADAAVRHQQCPNCECCAARAASKNKSFLNVRPKIHRRKPLPWNVHRSLRRIDVLRAEAELANVVSPVATASAPSSRASSPAAAGGSTSPMRPASANGILRGPSRTASPKPVLPSLTDSTERFSTGSMLDALTSLAGPTSALVAPVPTPAVAATSSLLSPSDARPASPAPMEFSPPPLSPLSPSYAANDMATSSDSDSSLPESSPERVVLPRKALPLPTFDRPLNCGYPVQPTASSFLVYASY